MTNHGQSRTQDKFDKKKANDVITSDELHRHFDLDGDGKVTKKEYDDHVEWHCNHPKNTFSPQSCDKGCKCQKFNPFYTSS